MNALPKKLNAIFFNLQKNQVIMSIYILNPVRTYYTIKIQKALDFIHDEVKSFCDSNVLKS